MRTRSPVRFSRILLRRSDREDEDGRELAHHVRVNAGAGDRAFTAAEIKEKFKNSTALVLSDAHAQRIYAAVMSLETIQARELGTALRL